MVSVLEDPIPAPSGRKPRRTKKIVKIPDSAFRKEIINFGKRHFGYINPYKKEKQLERILSRIDRDGTEINEDFPDYNFAYKVAKNKQLSMKELVLPLFEGGKYSEFRWSGTYEFLFKDIERYPNIELAKLILPVFWVGPVNDEARSEKDWRGAHKAPLIDDMTLFILFKKVPKDIKIRYGIMVPLTYCDPRIPEDPKYSYGHAVEMQFVQSHLASGHYFNIYEYSKDFVNGMKIAIRNYERLFKDKNIRIPFARI